MSTARGDARERDERTLQAYHDGELRGWARRRVERRLARSASLRRELRALALIGQVAREVDASAGAPDLWRGIEAGLEAAPAPGAGVAEAWRRWLTGWRPLGAAAVAAAAAAALVVALLPGAPEVPGAVRWMDSGNRSVMVLEGDADTTIIWVLEGATGRARPEGGGGVA